MTRRRKPFDPVAYQAELDAKCQRAGGAWMPARNGSVSRIPETQLEQHAEARREMRRLALPIGEDWDTAEQREFARKDRRA